MTDPITGELLNRNVAAGYYDPEADEFNPAAVWPSSADEGFLSTDRATVWTAEESFNFRTKTLKRKSRGVISLDVDELQEEWAIPTVSAPLVEGEDDAPADNPAHALSDYTHLIKLEKKDRTATKEAILAKTLERDWALGPIAD